MQRVVFRNIPADRGGSPAHRNRTAYQGVDKTVICRTLFNQSQKKVLGLDCLNFYTLHLLGNLDVGRMTTFTWQIIMLGHQTKSWKSTKGIRLYKPNMLNYTTVKCYRVVSLQNYLGQFC